MNTLIVVILYNKKTKDSKTLESLARNSYKDYKLIIVNNGPEFIEPINDTYLKLHFKNFSVENYVWNKSLSCIYNETIKNYYSIIDRFILLDDDTIVDDIYFKELISFYSKDIDLQIPRIKEVTNNLYYYPLINYRVFEKESGVILPDIGETFYHSIGSGLIIYKSLIDKFYNENMTLFDERFYLYGVDVSLFNRMYNLRKIKSIYFHTQVSGELLHSLSEATGEITSWRYKEKLYDSTLTHLLYSKSKFKKIYWLSRLIFKELKKLKFNNFLLILQTIKNRTHPKNLRK